MARDSYQASGGEEGVFCWSERRCDGGGGEELARRGSA